MNSLRNLGLSLVLLVAFAATVFAQAGPTSMSKYAQGFTNQGGETLVGSLSQAAIGTPSVGTAVATCSGTCATTYTYRCVASDFNGQALASTANTFDTIPSSSFTTTVGNATLSATQFNTITCGGQVGAVKYKVLKADNAHVIGQCFTESNVSCSVVDNSTAAGSAYTAQTVDQTGLTSPATFGASGTGINVLDATNGGHIDSLKGTAALPTIGTGSITAGGTDNALEATGATSPATVTFSTGFTNKPICVCGDETSALGACKVVPTPTTAVVTTTGTDSFMLICIGK